MSEAKPLPCPWCRSTDTEFDDGGADVFTVVCTGCNAFGPSAVPQSFAISEWNRIAGLPLLNASQRIRIEALEAELAELKKPKGPPYDNGNDCYVCGKDLDGLPHTYASDWTLLCVGGCRSKYDGQPKVEHRTEGYL